MNSGKPTYRLFAGLLAMLMLLTSSGLPIDLHFCQGQLKSVSLFGKAKTCHDLAQVASTCPHHQKVSTPSTACAEDEKGCCQNKTIFLDADQDQPIQISEFAMSQQTQQFVVAFVQTFFQPFFAEKTAPVLAHYKPPLIPRDVSVLFQSFLL